MQLRHRLLPLTAISFLSAVLTGCGGGGDLSSDELAKLEARVMPFVGHWVACWPVGANSSRKDDLRVSAAGEGSVRVARTHHEYAGSLNCTGKSVLAEEEQSDLTALGASVSVSDPVLGKVTLEVFSRTGRLIEYLADPNHPGQTIPTPSSPAPKAFAGVIPGPATALRVADDSTLDAQGNPTALLPLAYVKQP